MARLVETRTTETYRTRCPHCRSAKEHPSAAIVTIERDEAFRVIDLRVNCDWEDTQRDRT